MRVVGMMSGTSVDGIDAVCVDLTMEDQTLRVRRVAAHTQPYAEATAAAVAAALPPHQSTAQAWCEVDTRVGQDFADAAEALVAELDAPPDLVVSHGQTVFHWVDGEVVRGTLQVGQPAWVAERTGVPVVSDLRTRDVAAGGQGAPLVSAFDALWLAGIEARRPAALNLGGIANLTVVERSRDGAVGGRVLAFDTGPANGLLDAAVRTHTGGEQTFDRDGLLAAAGTVDPVLLDALLAEPYYALPAPKTTGRELFHSGYLADHQRAAGRDGIPLTDLAATLTELTARTVADAVRAHDADAVVAAGGGTANPVLLQRIRELTKPALLLTSSSLGVPAQEKEAIAFAVLGWLTWHGLTGTLPGATGAPHGSVLGSITPGREPLVLPTPLTHGPSRLVVG